MVAMLLDERGEHLEVIRVFLSPWEWELREPQMWLILATPAVIMAATQYIFLIPVLRMRPHQGGRAKSLMASMIAAGAVGAALAFGLYMGAFALAQHIISRRDGLRVPEDVDLFDAAVGVPLSIGVVIVGWVIWSVALLVFARRRQGRGVLGRVVGLLLGGTIIEVLVVLPVDIMIRRRTDCYCATGSFWTLCIASWALLWLAGPGAVIALTSRRRRAWWELHCEMCGYARGPSPGERCPECGDAWSAAGHRPRRAPALETPDAPGAGPSPR